MILTAVHIYGSHKHRPFNRNETSSTIRSIWTATGSVGAEIGRRLEGASVPRTSILIKGCCSREHGILMIRKENMKVSAKLHEYSMPSFMDIEGWGRMQSLCPGQSLTISVTDEVFQDDTSPLKDVASANIQR